MSMLALSDDYNHMKRYMGPDREWLDAYEKWDNHATNWKSDQNREWVSLRDTDIKYLLLQAGCRDSGIV